MRYFHAPLQIPKFFTAPDDYVNKDFLWVGEIREDQYEDEFGLPI